MLTWDTLQGHPVRTFPPVGGCSLYGRPEIDTQQKMLGLVLNAFQKPVDLFRWLIRHSLAKEAPVLSLFEGAGTGCLASLMENRDVTAVDFCAEMVLGTMTRVQT